MTARVLSLVLAAGVASSSDLGAQVARATLASSALAASPAKGCARVSLELSEYGNHGVILWRVAEGACGASGKVVVAKRAATRSSTPIFSGGGRDTRATSVSQANAPSLDTSKTYSFAVSWGPTRVAKDSLTATWSADVCAALEPETPARASREAGTVRP